MKTRLLMVEFVLVMTALYSVARFGKAAGYSPELEKLLGRKPTSLPQFVEDHKAVWERQKQEVPQPGKVKKT